MDGVIGSGDEGGVRVELFGFLFFLLMMVGEENSGRKEGEESEFQFHVRIVVRATLRGEVAFLLGRFLGRFLDLVEP